VDELLFYPYPESLSERLSNLKRVNFEKNEKYLRQKEKESKYFKCIFLVHYWYIYILIICKCIYYKINRNQVISFYYV
jgi:hypothetical protein